MEKLSTKIIDMRDDTNGHLLKEIFPSYDSIPEVIKTASRQEPQDHEYALILMNQGQRFRKFAMHDAGNTALSVLYFLKTASELPEVAIKTAAENLINASGRFHLPIPPELKELADNMSSKGVEIRTREKFWQPLDSLKRVGELEVGRKVASKNHQEVEQFTDEWNSVTDAGWTTPKMPKKQEKIAKNLRSPGYLFDGKRTVATDTRMDEEITEPGNVNKIASFGASKIAQERGLLKTSSNMKNKVLGTLAGVGGGAIAGGIQGGVGQMMNGFNPLLGYAVADDPMQGWGRGVVGGAIGGATAGAIGGGLSGAAFGLKGPAGQPNWKANNALGGYLGNYGGGLGGTIGAVTSKKKKSHRKEASNVVDVSTLEAPEFVEEIEAKYTLLDGEYPVDTFEQVKLAQEYFSENWKEFPPNIRREYCLKLAERMDNLGLSPSSQVERYGSQTYAADIDNHLNQRKNFVGEEYRELLDKMAEKRAFLQPETFAEALGEFDHQLGIDRYWDSRLADPYYATFGPSLDKIAEDNWNFTDMGLYINEQDLKTLAYQHIEKVRKQFGHDFAARFVGNPKGVFEKQDKETKIILARMASHDY